jgi:uncharacterized protein (DUF2126 family)
MAVFDPAVFDPAVFDAGGVTSNTSINLAAGSLSLTGYAPTITQPAGIVPGAGALSLAGFAPSIAQPRAVSAGLGQISITGFAPAISLASQQTNTVIGIVVTPTITMTGYVPTIARTAKQALTVGGSVAVSGYVPSVVIRGPVINLSYSFHQLKSDKYSVVHLSI